MLKIKKRKINKKDSVEDFVFHIKTARRVSPLPSEPVTVNKSFSDLESKNDKDQVAPEENNRTEPLKPKPPPPIHLKLRKISETNLNQLIENSQLIPIIQSKPLMRSHATTILMVPATDFHAHHHQPRSKTKPIRKQARGLRD
ncbi:uncharacterized protein TNCV_119081 [Trichonephila clavipes]|nr:uncharacterized protein TNCV_119081 [Trichonephila clavipes]